MRTTHRAHLILSAAFVAAIGVAGAWLHAQESSQPVNNLPNPYRQIENWAKLPTGRTIGAASAIDVDRDGKSIWVFDRCGANTCADSKVDPVLKFDATGRLVTSFGGGMFVFPHGLYIDRDDNVWVTDGQGTDGKGHQVVKFSPAGKVLMTLGKAGVAGDGPDTFNQPSDVLVAPNGDIFVADGHGGNSNARIVKFSKDGKFIKAWGKKGSGPGEFDTPHGLVMDAKGRLLVADRGNGRIQVFDQEGAFLAEWKQFGRPSGISLDRNGMLYSTDSQSGTPQVNPTLKRGVRIGSVTDGRVKFFIPDPDPIGEGVQGGREGVAVDRDGVVYISKTGDGGQVKFVAPSPATR
jgi:sugar lactone lactonase YvrE